METAIITLTIIGCIVGIASAIHTLTKGATKDDWKKAFNINPKHK